MQPRRHRACGANAATGIAMEEPAGRVGLVRRLVLGEPRVTVGPERVERPPARAERVDQRGADPGRRARHDDALALQIHRLGRPRRRRTTTTEQPDKNDQQERHP